MGLLSLDQKITYGYQAPRFFAAFSIVGSGLVLLILYRTWRKSRKLTTYDRLILGISIMDLVLSTALVCGPAPIPDGTPGYVGAHGTTATCTLQAFMLQVGNGTIFYSQMLLLNFVLTIRFNLREKTISKYIEPWMHILPLLYHFGTAFAALKLDLLNPSTIYCWIGPSPPGCWRDPTVECKRDLQFVFDFIFHYNNIPNVIWVLLMILYLIIVSATVIQKYRQSHRFRFERESVGCFNYLRDDKLRQVVVQSALYSFWFIGYAIWLSIPTFFRFTGRTYKPFSSDFWVVFLIGMFYPLQGLFNFFIYIRPRYLAIRGGALKDYGRWFAFREAVWHPVESRQIRERRASSRRRSSASRASASSEQLTPQRNFEAGTAGSLTQASPSDEYRSKSILHPQIALLAQEGEFANSEQSENRSRSSSPARESSNDLEPASEEVSLREIPAIIRPSVSLGAARLCASQPNLSYHQSERDKKVDVSETRSSQLSVRLETPNDHSESNRSTMDLRRASSLPSVLSRDENADAFETSVGNLFGLMAKDFR